MPKGKITFLEGAIAGVALGVAASMFLASKTGKRVKKEVAAMSADFYKYVAPHLKMLGEITQEEYVKFMDEAVDRYVKARKVSEKMAKQLKTEAVKSWKYFSGQIAGK